ncbi:uncharacterized protein LOC122805470 [Protopterus annectens]|uniref:uncharacterized protein LOC122805470 n=1 Tax=Protopterus annectens TaxID=7888 RepID=UPI001CF9E33E|nr:uncharacterized protein LOC122805470 [Protopterus annectens]
MSQNHLALNPNKTKLSMFTSQKNSPVDQSEFSVHSQNNTIIEVVLSTKLLGVIIDNNLTFDLHIHKNIKKNHQKLGALYRHNNFLSFSAKKALASSFLLPTLLYSAPILTNIQCWLEFSYHLTYLQLTFFFGFSWLGASTADHLCAHDWQWSFTVSSCQPGVQPSTEGTHTHTHTHERTHTLGNLESPVHLQHVFGMWEETRAPGRNQYDHREDMQTPHRSHPSRGSNRRTSCCDVATLTAAPLQLPYTYLQLTVAHKPIYYPAACPSLSCILTMYHPNQHLSSENKMLLNIGKPKLSADQMLYSFTVSKLWNNLPSSLRAISNRTAF